MHATRTGLYASHLYTQIPLILGHRGASAYAPENTSAAFERAVQLGADGLELDVTLSADGAPVVIHDDTVDRTTDGAGAVASLTLAELKSLDAGSKAPGAYAGERIPTLQEVLAAFGHQAIINIELKRDRSPGRQLAEKVVALVHAHGLQQRVIVSSFHLGNLCRVAQLDANLPVGLLYVLAGRGPRLARRLEGVLPHHAHHPFYHTVSADEVRWYHAQGYRVNVWTVNDEADMRRMIGLGVDGLITDRPDVAVAARSRWRV